MNKKNLIYLALSLLLSFSVEIISGLLTSASSSIYANLAKPPFSPPSIVFPIVWTVLFFLMGISSYLIFISHSPHRNKALKLYLIQLVVNFIWPIAFFNLQLYFLSILIIIALLILVFLMIKCFYKINPLAGKLQIPYFLWLIFATYLNIGVYFLNR